MSSNDVIKYGSTSQICPMYWCLIYTYLDQRFQYRFVLIHKLTTTRVPLITHRAKHKLLMTSAPGGEVGKQNITSVSFRRTYYYCALLEQNVWKTGRRRAQFCSHRAHFSCQAGGKSSIWQKLSWTIYWKNIHETYFIIIVIPLSLVKLEKNGLDNH